MRLGPVGALVLVLLACSFPPAAQAELVWTAPQTVSTGETNGEFPVAGVDASGGAVVAWQETEDGHTRVHVATRTRRGFLGSSQTLSPADRDADGARLAVGRDGTAVLAWNQRASAGSSVNSVAVAVRKPGEAFGAPEVLTSPTINYVLRNIGIDSNGNALVLGTRDDDAQHTSVVVWTRPPGGSFGGFTSLWQGGPSDPGSSAHANVYSTDMAFDKAGNALIVWLDNPTFSGSDQLPSEVRAIQRNANGTYLTQQLVASRGVGRSLNQPQVVAFNANRSVISYTRETSGVGDFEAEFAYREGLAGGIWILKAAEFGADTQWGPAAHDPTGAGIADVIHLDEARGRDVYLPPDAVSFDGARPLPAGIPETPTEFDDSGRGSLVFSKNDHLFFAQREPGPLPAYSQPLDLGPDDIGFEDLAVGPDGTAAVAYEVNDGENTRVTVRFGDLPQPAGTPTPPVPPAEPPPPPEPRVPSAIQVAGKIVSGRATVLTVSTSATANRVEWRVGKSTRALVGSAVNGVLQRSLRLRLDGPTDVSAKVFSPGGSQTYTRALTGAKAPTDGYAKEVLSGRPPNDDPVYATGTEGVLTGKASGCGGITVYSGALTISGCMRPIEGLADIPAGERGVLDALNLAYGLFTSNTSLLGRATELADGYAIAGTAMLNGRWPVTPVGRASLVAYPQAGVLTSSNAFVRVAGQPLRSYFSGFKLQLTTRSGGIDLGLVERPAGFPKLGGFPYTGDFTVSLGTSLATIDTAIKLPSFVRRNGVNLQPQVRLYATPDGLSTSSVPSLGPMEASFGLIDLKGLRISYDPGSNQWVGGMRACLFGPGCLNFQAPQGGIRLQGNELVYARTGQDFGSPGLTLSPGVFLQSIGAGFGLNPSRVFGGGRISLGSIVKLDGNELIAFPSAQAPYRLQRGEVGNAFPPSLYDTEFTRPLLAAGADVLLALPVLGETKLAGGYMLYEAPGYVALGGGAGVNVLGIFSVNGALGGEYNLANQRSNVHGDVSACLTAVDDDLCARSVVNVSRGPGLEGGAGACATLGPVSVGGGVLWARPGVPIIWPIDGCKWSPFKLDVRARASTSAARPLTSLEVTVGKQAKAVRLDGAGDSPMVRVTGPQTLDPGERRFAYTPNGQVRIVRADAGDAHFTTVGLQAPGTWRIELLPGSAAIVRSAQATDPPDARVSGRVLRGRGERRVLEYTVGRRPHQSVSFYDESAGGARKLIGTTRGGRGRLAFTPAPDRGRHKVLAAFTLGGLSAEERVVTRFSPPSPLLSTPRGLRVRRKGTKVLVSWRPVPGAARYELSLLAGPQRFATTKKPSLTFTKVRKSAAGSVTVRAVANLRQSEVRRAKVRRAGKTKTGGLKHCKVGKKKVHCR
ncbi:MAG TPA: hypothetical protein VG898_01425 [Solirubrobacterales bacterium]|nr:hypothetical protein [Solirubrobacterales bacterium]